MGISPPSDLIVDVLRAAEPGRAKVATQKLSQMAPTEKLAAKSAFSLAMSEATKDSKPATSSSSAGAYYFNDPEMTLTNMRNHSAAYSRAENNKPQAVAQKFEAQILQNFVQLMLPKNSEALYGGGTAGGMWRSMMAEKLAEQMAVNGGTGIAEQVFGKDLAALKPSKA